uniref:Sulfatase-modifying factor enzyme-like domain-containing protein n=1 Tax=Tetradesmus obliquus TaxID=3088 RepID=A0A383VXG0_TETOB|eukprot:jgi/Sobl393_1/12403/SZX69881.1
MPAAPLTNQQQAATRCPAEGGSPAPTYSEWQRLWQLWDTVTLDMLPPGSHAAQPLALRHPFIFYLGHLPAFTDARLARVLGQDLTEPQGFAVTFARGIDPDLDDPSKCHAHSPVPEQWPELPHILQYRDCVRQRIAQLYAQHSSCSSSSSSSSSSVASATAETKHGTTGGSTSAAAAAEAAGSAAVAAMSSKLQHVLWLCYEHEAMHLETLLYMLVQYERTKAPPAAAIIKQQAPAAAAAAADAAAVAGNTGSSSSNGKAAAQEGGSALNAVMPRPPAAHMVQLPADKVTLGFSPTGWQQQQQQQQAATQTAQAAAQEPRQLLRFGWDNETPARTADVAGCAMQHRPVCVLEYLWFLAHKLAAAAAAAAAPDDLLSESADGSGSSKTTSSSSNSSGSSSSERVLQLLCDGGSLQGLLPLSLQLNTAAAHRNAAVPAAAAAVQDAESNAHTTADGSSSSSGSQQQLFEALQQLVSVKSVFGPVHVSAAGLWPVYCSALQADAYAAWWDGGSCRLPTEGELLLARQYNDDVARQYNADGGRQYNADVARQYNDGTARQYNDDVARQYNDDVARQYNDMVRQYNTFEAGPHADDSNSSNSSSSSSSSSSAAGSIAAVDFQVWHPVEVQLQPPMLHCYQQQQQQQQHHGPAMQLHAEAPPLLSQLTDNGWEWSSTAFEAHPGFEPHPRYPEYSADFFDGKHRVLLGASWATLGAIASRGSFRNWYQAGQQHVFAKFRLCRSV